MKIKRDFKNKVLIVVRGGTIQGVFSSEKDLEVDILDYDNEEFSDDRSAKIEFGIRKSDLFELPTH